MSKRSLKVEGTTTSLFLEDAFWQEIQIRAEGKGISNAELLRELLAATDQLGNRSAAIKEHLMLELRKEYTVLQRKKDGALKSKWLIEIDGVRSRKEFKQNVITIGTSSTCDIHLKGSHIAAKQALLSYDGSHWWVVNIAPSLPLFLFDEEVAVAQLVKNSEIHIGTYQVIKG